MLSTAAEAELSAWLINGWYVSFTIQTYNGGLLLVALELG